MTSYAPSSTNSLILTPANNQSLAEAFAALPRAQREAIIGALTAAEAEQLAYDWRFWGRQNQFLPPGDWLYWLLLAGRGFGKTRTGGEAVRDWERQGVRRIALVAPTAADARDVMVEGESGILSLYPDADKPLYEPSKRRITWRSGCVATLFSAEEPERLRGPQHEKAWCDELAAWKYLQETWDMLQFGLRLGSHPQAVITTTPKPLPLVRELLQQEGADVHVTRGSTYDNKGNLAKSFLKKIISKYEGTRLGRQELHAELLDDIQGALWTLALIEATRIRCDEREEAERPELPQFDRVVVAVDPNVSAGEDADECGIVVAASGLCSCKAREGIPLERHLFVLADVSAPFGPNDWIQAVGNTFDDWDADRVIGEVNNGGDLVEIALRTYSKNLPYKKVTASRGKRTRAEPVAALYEQGKVHHLGVFPNLEEQMTTYVPLTAKKSPDRMDALVWAATELMLQEVVPEPRVHFLDDDDDFLDEDENLDDYL